MINDLKCNIEKIRQMIKTAEEALIFIEGQLDAESDIKSTNDINNILQIKSEEFKMESVKDLKIYRHGNRFEARYRKYGYDKSFSGGSIEEAVKKARPFLKELNQKFSISNPPPRKSRSGMYINKYLIDFINNVKKPFIKERTYYVYMNRIEKHILPEIGDYDIRTIKTNNIQPIFNKLETEEKRRTSEDVFFILNMMFENAIANRIITFNPLLGIQRIKHTRKIGQALSYEDEAALIKDIKGTKFEYQIIFLLYSGLRPCELCTAHIENNFIFANNLKRKNKQTEFKKIPITPMMNCYMDNIKKMEFDINTHYLTKIFGKLTKNKYTVKDLRHTFVTRAQTCGVPESVVRKWAGHTPNSSDMTRAVYTHFDDNFMLEMSKKVYYKDKILI